MAIKIYDYNKSSLIGDSNAIVVISVDSRCLYTTSRLVDSDHIEKLLVFGNRIAFVASGNSDVRDDLARLLRDEFQTNHNLTFGGAVRLVQDNIELSQKWEDSKP
ncbi:OLC1v1005630C1 [Oldenlandia corymbosa var. corymbosa]|uniref:OLC1v1005630C1 n=1 Tax=Oldenlandia corymbosa var. corymbosa TaxID=529605 RepID=A0AAV1DF33_OLDCO|nr:OLC1v1005630C1 [Oldenlandia corymbosa var. corymbosa]